MHVDRAIYISEHLRGCYLEFKLLGIPARGPQPRARSSIHCFGLFVSFFPLHLKFISRDAGPFFTLPRRGIFFRGRLRSLSGR
jgi:hypothetical protein